MDRARKETNSPRGAGFARLAYAAAHVVRKAGIPDGSHLPIREQIDWDATAAYRRYLWSLGLGVAEAMDTAQRSLLGWDAASELIERTLEDSRNSPTEWRETIAGAGTDGLKPDSPSLAQIIDEYVRQGRFIQERGGTVMLLATPLMPRLLPRPADYVELYTQVVRQLEPPLFVHWLGPMFAENLRGYFPSDSFLEIMDRNADRIRGVKLSMLDEAMEIDLRRRLLSNNQIMLTGDDYNYVSLIEGDGAITGRSHIEIRGRRFPIGEFSHALLGIFDAIAPVASKALAALSRGDLAQYRRLLEPTLPLARAIFEPPTENYKAGVVFLAWLGGHQPEFSLLGDLHLSRPREHYSRIAQLAVETGMINQQS